MKFWLAYKYWFISKLKIPESNYQQQQASESLCIGIE
jgi:hypothetical protein